jgi:hypothetical protein
MSDFSMTKGDVSHDLNTQSFLSELEVVSTNRQSLLAVT